jgi:putative transposase
MRWLTVTHTQRWHAAHRTAGTGPLYQGRFKSFPIQEGEHLWTVLRYVERNPLRAKLVDEAVAWRWSSLWHRTQGNPSGLLDDGPLALPRRWVQVVQRPETAAELEALRRSVVRGAPFGEAAWQERTVKRLGLQSTLRPRGRPWPKKPE